MSARRAARHQSFIDEVSGIAEVGRRCRAARRSSSSALPSPLSAPETDTVTHRAAQGHDASIPARKLFSGRAALSRHLAEEHLRPTAGGADQRLVMPPELEIERLEYKVAEIQAEIEEGTMPLEKLIKLCVLKHDCLEAISRYRALRHSSRIGH